MKLGEALIKRADLQKKIGQLRARLGQNAKIQEGDEPAELITNLLAEYDKTSSVLEKLIKRINRTNSATSFRGGTIIDSIVEGDSISAKIKTYRELYEAAINKPERFGRLEIKYVKCVDVAMLQNQINDLSKDLRTLDIALQECNWNTELLD